MQKEAVITLNLWVAFVHSVHYFSKLYKYLKYLLHISGKSYIINSDLTNYV